MTKCLGGAALLLAVSSLVPALAAPPAASVFGTLPDYQDVTISPNGDRLAWYGPTGDRTQLVVLPLDGGKPTLAPLGIGKPRDIIWATNDIPLIEFSVASNVPGDVHWTVEVYRTIALDLTTGVPHLLKAGPQSSGNSAVTVHDMTHDGSGDVFVAIWEFHEGSYTQSTGTHVTQGNGAIANAVELTLYRVNPKTGSYSLLAEGTTDTLDFAIGRGDKPVARMDLTPHLKQFKLFTSKSGAWSPVFTEEHAINPPFDFLGLEQGGSGLIMMDRRSDAPKFARLDLSTGTITPVFEGELNGPARSARTDPYTGEVIEIAQDEMAPRPHWLDEQLKDLQHKLGQAFAGQRVAISSWSRDRKNFVITVDSPSTPTTNYLLDATTLRADTIGDEYPGLSGAPLGDKREHPYTARDGATIPAYLTLPPGKAPKNLPLVLMPHGGPASQDEPGFDWWAQFVATRGYAVLQPEFRGSTGFGKAWEYAGHHQWGKLMQDDLTDGVKALIADGTVDPKRVCIVGWSYGGYAALAGATLTPELYACAASIAGVSDLSQMLGYVKKQGGRWSPSLNYWRDNIGNPDDPETNRVSPALHATDVRAPILLIHGRDDTVVPFEQSLRMKMALEAAGKDVTLVQLEDEDHWMSTAATRTRMLTELEKFLTKHLGQ